MGERLPRSPDSDTAGPAAGMPRIRVDAERERPHGWEFDVSIPGGEGVERAAVVVLLSWADCELWSGGSSAPSRVAEEVVRFAASRGLLDRLGGRFDAATVRRLDASVDAALPRLL